MKLTGFTAKYALAAIVFVASMAHAESAVVNKSVMLRDQPYLDAKPLGGLPAKTAVEIVSHQAGWVLVNVGNDREGWVRIFDLDTSGNRQPLRTPPVPNTLLDTVRKGQANPEQLQRLQQASVSSKDAFDAARAAGLTQLRLDWLP